MSEYIMALTAQLPTSEVAEIVRRLRPRLYINFFNNLPPEVCLKILGFLDPDSLIRTAQASREWMLLALDRRLWEQLYLRDGFRVIRSEILQFESTLNPEQSRSSGNILPANKSRISPGRILSSGDGGGDIDMMDLDTPMQKQASIFGPVMGSRHTREPVQDHDVVMASPRSPSTQASPSFDRQNNPRRQSKQLSDQSYSSGQSPFLETSSLTVLDRSTNRKWLNWQYLYAQRRRLEANWEAEKYKNFQLPHPKHPEEAHDECIYTIQHSGRFLVSGSRDRTLRIWDLDTQRLIRPPLRAHTGSVLCLQFDADPEEDLIVSGSSDATIVLWKFSTGQIIQRLRKAHRESVLNVRFDKRVLVTCSKDKLIKIFNRRPMSPGDLGYPGLPGGVHPVPTYLNNYGFNPSPTAGLPVKPPYSLIGCLEGHGAAVNAVQIHGNEVVSASGDRTVKIWNWPDQTCTRTLIGHAKGIACVQYDGRRIVSGSSDNEVKVFDSASGVQVAALHAHTNLVRTVQAGFGDLPYSAEEDQEDAKMVDQEYFDAVDSGALSADVPLKGRPSNAGSRKPEHITSYGAKVPPGGGGGRFGRIVSGSYDETIIIWRRDKEGLWKAQHVLRQEEAARAASRMVDPEPEPEPEEPAQPSRPSTPPQQTANETTDADAPDSPFVPGGNAWYRHLVDITIPQGPAALRHVLQSHPQLLTRNELSEKIATLPASTQHMMRSVIASAIQNQQNLIVSANSTVPSPIQPQTQTNTTTASTNGPAGNSTSSTSNSMNPPVVNTPAQVAAAPAPAPALVPVPAPNAHHHAQANMARVFKLQFDARRIICCSQTSVIVGWDFANGDKELIESSRFFAPIE